MDNVDRRILQELQQDFPLEESPYDIVAARLEMAKEDLWERVQRLLDERVIRRIGASVDSRKFGFRSTLAAVSVEPERVERAAVTIGEFHEVTHSYLRDDAFNIWFTVIAADDERIEEILERIRRSLSLEERKILNLPAKRLFKLDARFGVKERS